MADNIVSLQLSDSTRERLERLSKTMHRSTSALAAEALETFINEQEWQIAAIDEAVRLAEDGEFAAHDAMSAWLKSWGTDEETPAPEPDVFKAQR